MGNKNSVIKKYNYISYYKIKLLNLNFNDNKIYVLLFPKYLLFVDKNGEEIYKVIYNDIKIIDVITDNTYNIIKDRINIELNNSNNYIINTYKKIDDNLNIAKKILENINKNIKIVYNYKTIKYIIKNLIENLNEM